MAIDDAEQAVLRALPVDLDELADLLEGGDDVRHGLVDLQTGEVHPYSEMLGEYLGLDEDVKPDEAATRVDALLGADIADDDDVEEDRSTLALIRSDPGNVGLESMLTEIDKLLAVRAVGLPTGLFADVAPKVVAGWRARATVEAPSHLRTHPRPLRLTLLAALPHSRERRSPTRWRTCSSAPCTGSTRGPRRRSPSSSSLSSAG